MEDTTAEFLVEEVEPQVDLRVLLGLKVAGKTDLGRVRENNEDKFEFFCPSDDSELASKGSVFIVCDGMGGHEAGQIASELACKTFIDVYRKHPSTEPEEAARSAVLAANRFVLDVSRAVPSRKGMGCTLSAAILVQDKLVIAQVGDSRVYRLRDGELTMLTNDHTWIEETVAAGMMPREQAEQSPYRHVITRAIGTEADVKPDIFTFDIRKGDELLICSDGLTNHVSDDELLRELTTTGPSEAGWNLVNAALVDGGSDNTTVLIVRVDSIEPV